MLQTPLKVWTPWGWHRCAKTCRSCEGPYFQMCL